MTAPISKILPQVSTESADLETQYNIGKMHAISIAKVVLLHALDGDKRALEFVEEANKKQGE